MRILIVDTYYAAFLESHYAGRPGLAEASYDLQWRALMDRCFGTSDAYSHYLGKLGHDACAVVINCEPLQRVWAREHGIRLRKRILAGMPLVLTQAEEFRPDVAYVQDLRALGPRVLRLLRERSQLLVGQIASEAPSHDRLAAFDLVLTSFPHFVPSFRSRGVATEYLRLGFDPRVLARLEGETQTSGAVFVGGIGRSSTWQLNTLLERAAERVPIEFWGHEVGKLPAGTAIRRQYRGEAWGLDMYRVLARSKIALNRHGDIAGDYANNMRLYEATGVGTLLVTDAKGNLSELFKPVDEVVTYSSEDELVERINHYLDDEAERQRIAQAGQARTLSDHSYEQRMRELVDVLARYMP